MDVVYLNNAGQARYSDEVQKAGIETVQRSPWLIHASDDQQAVRRLFAKLIQADDSDIAIVPSTAFSITLVARNIQRSWRRKTSKDEANDDIKGRILVLQDQYDSAVYPWQAICQDEADLSLLVVQTPESESGNWTESVLKNIREHGDQPGEKLVAVCLPPLHWSDGSRLDLEAISSLCHELRIPLIVDATQAVGAVSVNVQKIRPFVLACSSHKWLRGPAGTCCMYIAKDLHDAWEPLDEHGRSRIIPGGSNWNAYPNVMGPTGYPEAFVSDARKFDSGGKANPTLLPMLRAALEQVVTLDFDDMQQQLETLMQPLLTWALQHGWTIPTGPTAHHIVGIRPPWTVEKMLQVCDKMEEEQGVVVAIRCGAFRISPYLDNSKADIERLMKALEQYL